MLHKGKLQAALNGKRGQFTADNAAFNDQLKAYRYALDAVRYGKSRGAHLTCEVTPHHFVLTDDALAAPEPYDTNVKMNPPLREAADRDAMLQGLADGSIDVIATDHAPHHYDEKRVEFDQAPFGITGLETAVPLCFDRLVHAGAVSLTRLVELLSVNPARILRLPGGSLSEGAPSGRIMNSWKSIGLSACTPPLMMFIIGTGKTRAWVPPT